MPISGTRYRPTTPNVQRSTPNVSMEAVRFEVLGVGRWALGVERSLVASSLLSISSLTVPTKPQLLWSLRARLSVDMTIQLFRRPVMSLASLAARKAPSCARYILPEYRTLR